MVNTDLVLVLSKLEEELQHWEAQRKRSNLVNEHYPEVNKSRASYDTGYCTALQQAKTYVLDAMKE
jgi:hypothetical protein